MEAPAKEILQKHLAIMDKYDPENQISLIADEWGNWHDTEPGTNPGFLFQQNTLRDAVTAAIYLNIFNNSCYRVKMANIAQTINVLQAMVLTSENQIVKTPTFYVFKLYKVHFDALMLPTEVTSENYESGEYSFPPLSVSTSKNSDGDINITIANVTPDKDILIDIEIKGGAKFRIGKSEIITSDKMNSYNDFGKEEEVSISEFNDIRLEGKTVKLTIPSKSVLLINLKH